MAGRLYGGLALTEVEYTYNSRSLLYQQKDALGNETD